MGRIYDVDIKKEGFKIVLSNEKDGSVFKIQYAGTTVTKRHAWYIFKTSIQSNTSAQSDEKTFNCIVPEQSDVDYPFVHAITDIINKEYTDTHDLSQDDIVELIDTALSLYMDISKCN